VSNLMDGRAERGSADGSCRVRLGDFGLTARRGDLDAAGPVKLVVRPERVSIEPHGGTGQNKMPGMVERLVYSGPTTQVIIRLAPGHLVQAMIPNRGDDVTYEQGTPVTVFLPPDALRVLRTDKEVPEPSSDE